MQNEWRLTRAGQVTLENAVLGILVTMGVVMMAGYLTRAINAYFQTGSEQVRESFAERITQAPATGEGEDLCLGCKKVDEDQGCAGESHAQCQPYQLVKKEWDCGDMPEEFCGKTEYACSDESAPKRLWSECVAQNQGALPFGTRIPINPYFSADDSKNRYDGWAGCGYTCCTKPVRGSNADCKKVGKTWYRLMTRYCGGTAPENNQSFYEEDESCGFACGTKIARSVWCPGSHDFDALTDSELAALTPGQVSYLPSQGSLANESNIDDASALGTICGERPICKAVCMEPMVVKGVDKCTCSQWVKATRSTEAHWKITKVRCAPKEKNDCEKGNKTFTKTTTGICACPNTCTDEDACSGLIASASFQSKDYCEEVATVYDGILQPCSDSDAKPAMPGWVTSGQGVTGVYLNDLKNPSNHKTKGVRFDFTRPGYFSFAPCLHKEDDGWAKKEASIDYLRKCQGEKYSGKTVLKDSVRLYFTPFGKPKAGKAWSSDFFERRVFCSRSNSGDCRGDFEQYFPVSSHKTKPVSPDLFTRVRIGGNKSAFFLSGYDGECNEPGTIADLVIESVIKMDKIGDGLGPMDLE